MLKAIRDFFDRQLAPADKDAPAAAEHRTRLAAAALLVEVVRSDEQFSDVERRSVVDSVRRKFRIDDVQAGQLLALAEAETAQSHDLFQFTSRINATFQPEQKARLLEELWRAAYADAVVHKYEEHLIRRVADLLHVPHSTFIAAKLRVQQSLQQPGA
jgi:uncharacterized tellurite resistance protein B-like protein